MFSRVACRGTVVCVLAIIGASAAARACTAATPGTSPRRPNILWIMSDQLRYDCLGASGNRIIKTPNLDRLAQQSANFTQAFVQAPVCVPSRASYFTGRYPHSHRNRVNYTPLAAGEVLFPTRLQAAGYRTTLVGKTHLYYRYPPTPDEARRTGFELVDLHDGVPFTDPWSGRTMALLINKTLPPDAMMFLSKNTILASMIENDWDKTDGAYYGYFTRLLKYGLTDILRAAYSRLWYLVNLHPDQMLFVGNIDIDQA